MMLYLAIPILLLIGWFTYLSFNISNSDEHAAGSYIAQRLKQEMSSADPGCGKNLDVRYDSRRAWISIYVRNWSDACSIPKIVAQTYILKNEIPNSEKVSKLSIVFTTPTGRESSRVYISEKRS